jgi:hypothetical protein
LSHVGFATTGREFPFREAGSSHSAFARITVPASEVVLPSSENGIDDRSKAALANRIPKGRARVTGQEQAVDPIVIEIGQHPKPVGAGTPSQGITNRNHRAIPSFARLRPTALNRTTRRCRN